MVLLGQVSCTKEVSVVLIRDYANFGLYLANSKSETAEVTGSGKDIGIPCFGEVGKYGQKDIMVFIKRKTKDEGI